MDKRIIILEAVITILVLVLAVSNLPTTNSPEVIEQITTISE